MNCATVVLLIGVLTTNKMSPAGGSNPTGTLIRAVGQAADNGTPVAAPANVCYCGGKSFGEGHQACMGGFKMVCAKKGWANMKSGADNIRCSPDKCD